MSFKLRIEATFKEILAKVGVIGARVKTYIEIALSLGKTLEAALSNQDTALVIKDILATVGITDPNLEEDIDVQVPKIMALLTQSDAVLNAGTPDQMLKAFIVEIQKDLPAVQKSKIWTFLSKLVASLDGNIMAEDIYELLLKKFNVAALLGVTIA